MLKTILLGVLLAAAARALPVELVSARFSANRSYVTVRFGPGDLPALSEVTCPAPPCRFQVYEILNGTQSLVNVTSSRVVPIPSRTSEQSFAQFRSVTVELSRSIDLNASALVLFQGVGSVMPQSAKAGSTFSPVEYDDDATFKLSGQAVTSAEGSPTFSTDSILGVDFIEHTAAQPDLSLPPGGTWGLGFRSEFKLDSSETYNPRSITASIPLSYTPGGRSWPPTFRWYTARAEGDDEAKIVNLLSSPVLTIPFNQPVFETQANGSRRWKMTLGLAPFFGIEAGKTMRQRFILTATGEPISESSIFRGLVGATGRLTLPAGSRRLRFVSRYQVRLPATDEVWLDFRDLPDIEPPAEGEPVVLFNRRPRHHVENNVEFALTDYLSFTFKHEWGVLPPAFSFLNHRTTFGLVFRGAQNRGLFR